MIFGKLNLKPEPPNTNIAIIMSSTTPIDMFREPCETRIASYRTELNSTPGLFEKLRQVYRDLERDKKGAHKPFHFIYILRKFSTDQTSDFGFVDEWDLHAFRFDLRPKGPKGSYKEHCICGQGIYKQVYIRNNTNGNILEVGANCLEKLGPYKPELLDRIKLLNSAFNRLRTSFGNPQRLELNSAFAIACNKCWGCFADVPYAVGKTLCPSCSEIERQEAERRHLQEEKERHRQEILRLEEEETSRRIQVTREIKRQEEIKRRQEEEKQRLLLQEEVNRLRQERALLAKEDEDKRVRPGSKCPHPRDKRSIIMIRPNPWCYPCLQEASLEELTPLERTFRI